MTKRFAVTPAGLLDQLAEASEEAVSAALDADGRECDDAARGNARAAVFAALEDAAAAARSARRVTAQLPRLMAAARLLGATHVAIGQATGAQPAVANNRLNRWRDGHPADPLVRRLDEAERQGEVRTSLPHERRGRPPAPRGRAATGEGDL